jgi:predicted GNAT family acetyltransferase
MGLVDLRGREKAPEVRALLEPVRGSIPIGWEEEGDLVACAAVERTGPDEIALRSIVVAAERRGRGYGRALVDAIADVATSRRLVADCDPGARPFLERCAFVVDEGRCVRELGAAAAPAEHIAAMTLAELEDAVRAAWGADTTDEPERWSPANPALGQCDVTALLVRELLGGEILVANVVRDGRRVGNHAWNRLPSGLAVDLTRTQFVDGEALGEPTVREPAIATGATERYRVFAARVRARVGRPS